MKPAASAGRGTARRNRLAQRAWSCSMQGAAAPRVPLRARRSTRTMWSRSLLLCARSGKRERSASALALHTPSPPLDFRDVGRRNRGTIPDHVRPCAVSPPLHDAAPMRRRSDAETNSRPGPSAGPRRRTRLWYQAPPAGCPAIATYERVIRDVARQTGVRSRTRRGRHGPAAIARAMLDAMPEAKLETKLRPMRH